MVVPSIPLASPRPASRRAPLPASSWRGASPPVVPPRPAILSHDSGDTDAFLHTMRQELDYSWQVVHFALIEHRGKQEKILQRMEAHCKGDALPAVEDDKKGSEHTLEKSHESPHKQMQQRPAHLPQLPEFQQVQGSPDRPQKEQVPQPFRRDQAQQGDGTEGQDNQHHGHEGQQEHRHAAGGDHSLLAIPNDVNRHYTSEAKSSKSGQGVAKERTVDKERTWQSERSTAALKRKKLEKDKSLLLRDVEEIIEDYEHTYEMEFGVAFTNRLSYSAQHVSLKLTLEALRCFKWFLTLEEPPRTGRLAAFVQSWTLSAIANIMILANAIFMVYIVDYVALRIDQPDTAVPLAATVIDTLFLVFFFFELLVRMIVHRLYFFCNKDLQWNIFDFFLVVFSIGDSAISLFADNGSSHLNVMFLRSFRILRLARTLRVIRVLRFASQLRRMLQSVIGSLMSLIWVFVMLFFVLFIAGIGLVQTVSSSLLADPNPDLEDPDRIKVLELFGSVYQASLSFYIVCAGGAAWVSYFRALESVSQLGALLFICVIGFIQFALMNILTGIFVENAMKVAKPDRESRALDQRRAEIKDTEEFRVCLKELDVDCNGTITLEEFRSLRRDPRAHAMFTAIGLDVKDAELFFDMVCRSCKTSEVDFDFLIEACMKMRGYATSIDANAIMYRLQMLDMKVGTLGALAMDY